MESIEQELFGLQFDAGKSIRYHSHMRSAWNKADHWNKVLTLFFGTSVVVSLLAKLPTYELIASIATAFLSSLDIVFGFSDKSLMHDKLYRKWIKLLCEIEEAEYTQEKVKKLRIYRHKIERDEPDVITMIERYSAFEEAQSLGCEINSVWKLKSLQVFLIKVVW